MKKIKEPGKIFLNEYDIKVVECPKCQAYIPNVTQGPVTCPDCRNAFLAIEVGDYNSHKAFLKKHGVDE